MGTDLQPDPGSEEPLEIVEYVDQGRPTPKDAIRTEEATRHDQNTRKTVTMALFGLLAMCIVSAVWLLGFHRATSEEVLDFVDHIFVPLIALTGTALGFYFGGGGKRPSQ